MESLALGSGEAVKYLVKKRLDKVPGALPEADAIEAIQGFDFPKQDVEELRAEMDALQTESNLPHLGPCWTMGLIGLNYAVHSFVGFMALDRRLALIQAEMKEQNRIARQRAQRVNAAAPEPEQAAPEPTPRPAGVSAERAAEMELDQLGGRGGGE